MTDVMENKHKKDNVGRGFVEPILTYLLYITAFATMQKTKSVPIDTRFRSTSKSVKSAITAVKNPAKYRNQCKSIHVMRIRFM